MVDQHQFLSNLPELKHGRIARGNRLFPFQTKRFGQQTRQDLGSWQRFQPAGQFPAAQLPAQEQSQERLARAPVSHDMDRRALAPHDGHAVSLLTPKRSHLVIPHASRPFAETAHVPKFPADIPGRALSPQTDPNPNLPAVRRLIL